MVMSADEIGGRKMERKNVWTSYDERQLKELETLNEGYKDFLSRGKTERECVNLAVSMAEAAGYQNLDEVKELKAGDKVYAVGMKKTIVLYQIGTKPIEEALHPCLLFL